MLAKRLIKSNDAGGGACTNTVDLYNPFPDGGGQSLWQLNGTPNDVSGSFNGTWNGTPSYTTGIFGQAANFAGTQGITFADNVMPYNNFTISFWFKVDWAAVDYLFSFTRYGNTSFSTRTDGTVAFFSRGTTISESYSATIDYSSSTDWHNIVFTKSSTNGAALYSDGQFVWSDPSFTQDSSFYDGNDRINAIGATWKNGAFLAGCNGSVDQVRLFTRALRPYEVEALYTEEYCTPTIVPSEHFNTVTYTGDGGVKSVTDVGFQPDFSWIKRRDGGTGYFHQLYDSVRGVEKVLFSNDSLQEYDRSNGLTSFDSNGFTLGDHPHSNESGGSYVAWNFKAGGAAVTNTDGTITSQVSANTEAGFSVVSYTGNGVGGATVGHGLGVQPSITIQKNLSNSANWAVLGKALEDANGGNKSYLLLNTTNAIGGASQVAADSSVIYNWSDSTNNASANQYIAYVFAQKEGFSNFGTYTGTGTTSGETIITGFEPAFVMTKRVDAGSSWYIADNKRNPADPRNLLINVNVSDAEIVGTGTSYFNFYENGFQVTASTAELNASGGTYLYMAFAADPTTIEPTLEDSFNTVTYTGNGGTQSISTVGFQPDLSWFKKRSGTQVHNLYDSVRGVSKVLYSNLTNAEATVTSISSFDNNGFTLGNGGADTNASGETYVAWNWKGAELPAINSNGSIPSVVSANPAAGFSIVSLTIPSSGSPVTVGHGLGSAPKVVIVKTTEKTGSWFVYTEMTGADKEAYLELTNAWGVDPNRWNNTSPTSNVFTLGTSWLSTNYSGSAIAYCFAEVAGFSKFGSYNGSHPTRQTIVTGFEPAFVMIKRTDDARDWVIFDNKRFQNNQYDAYLAANTSAAEAYMPDLANYTVEFLSNGFSVQDGSFVNLTGGTYIFMAFANQF